MGIPDPMPHAPRNPPILDPPWLPARAMSTATTTATRTLIIALRLFPFMQVRSFHGLPRAAARHCSLGLRSGDGGVWVGSRAPTPSTFCRFHTVRPSGGTELLL